MCSVAGVTRECAHLHPTVPVTEKRACTSTPGQPFCTQVTYDVRPQASSVTQASMSHVLPSLGPCLSGALALTPLFWRREVSSGALLLNPFHRSWNPIEAPDSHISGGLCFPSSPAHFYNHCIGLRKASFCCTCPSACWKLAASHPSFFLFWDRLLLLSVWLDSARPCGYHSSWVCNHRFRWGVLAHTVGIPRSRSGVSCATVSPYHPFPFWCLLLVEAEWPLLSLVGLAVSRPHVSVHLCLPTARPKPISGQTTCCHRLGATPGLGGRRNAFWLWSRARWHFS